MASETGATPDQIERALRSRAYQSYTKREMANRAIEKGLFSANTINDTLNGWAPHLVHPDERIVSVSDLEAVCKAARHEVDRLYEDGCRVCIQKADALGAIIERLCEVIGGPQ